MTSDFENITPPEIDEYCENHSSDLELIFEQINRETFIKTAYGRMLSGKMQANLLKILCSLKNPKNALEIGSFTGYSAVAIASQLKENAKLYSIEVNPEYEDMLKNNLTAANLNNRVEIIIGDAKEIIPKMNISFDFVYLDANKRNYPEYFDIIMEKLNKGGLFIADNVLWSGKIVDDASKDADVAALRKFNDKVQNDKCLRNILLPLRDGLMVAERIL
jgi:predicted O-methyltransferase YrrM